MRPGCALNDQPYRSLCNLIFLSETAVPNPPRRIASPNLQNKGFGELRIGNALAPYPAFLGNVTESF